MAYRLVSRAANIMGKKLKGFPLILDQNSKVVRSAQRYLTCLYRQGHSLASVYLYSSHLIDFISQLEVDRLHVSDVYDEYLEAYSEAMQIRGCGKRYTAQLLGTVLMYLEWMQARGLANLLIGEGAAYRIKIIKTQKGISHKLTRPEKGFRGRRSSVPCKESIEIVQRNGAKTQIVNDRFELMVDWGAVCGLRAKEICGLRIESLPTRSAAEKAIRASRNVDVTLFVTKGGRSAVITASPLLVIKTLNWVEVVRPEIVDAVKERALRNGEKYEDVKEVFISLKTGGALLPGSLSNAVRNAFKHSVAKQELIESDRVWLHGLRSYMVNTELRARDKAGQRNPENILRHQTRHASIDSMQPYVQDRYDREFSDGE